MKRVLVVEDEPSLARGLLDNLRDDGYEALHVADGAIAEDEIRRLRPDAVVLDLMLPGRSGLDVLRSLRAAGEDVPVLVLTAKGDVVDRVVGLEMGADDYMGKPFAVRELLARVKALLRRSEGRSAPSLRIGSAEIDFVALQARGPSGPLPLTPHDLRVLEVLARRRGQVVPRADIVEEVCGLDSEATLRTVDNHVVALRRALEPDPRRPRFLITVRGEGYRLVPDTR